jgi:hypothetical protein
MPKKKLSRNARETVIAAPGEGETTISLDQPAKNNVNAGEEVVILEDLPATPDTSADEAAVDAGKQSNLEPYKSTISYAET